MSPESPRPHLERPVARVIPVKDFSEVLALFSDWRGEFEQFSRGRFEGALRFMHNKVIRIHGITGNQRLRLRGHDVAGLFSVYPVTDGNADSLWQHRRLSPGQLVVQGVGSETDHYSARRTENLGLSLHPADLEGAARDLLGTDAVSLPHSWAALSPPPEAFARLNRQLSTLLSRGAADPSHLGTPEADRLEQECVRALVASLFPAASPQPDLSRPARTLLVRRAEEFMRSRLGAPMGAVDLCRELGVSDRTLRLAFRESFGLGPMAYFKKIRLNAIRLRLRTDSAVPIAFAAHEFGFHHLSNFAADSRRLLGERPSETVRG